MLKFRPSPLPFGLWILDSGLWFLEFRSRFPHSPKSKVLGLWALDLGLWVMDFVLLRILVLGYLNFRFSALNFELWTLDSGFCFLEFRSRFRLSPKSLDFGLWTIAYLWSSWPFAKSQTGIRKAISFWASTWRPQRASKLSQRPKCIPNCC